MYHTKVTTMMYLVISICFIITVTKANFEWSYQGPISDKHCVQWREPSDPNTWHDNYLCSDEDFGIKFSYSGPINGLRCTRIYEPADPHTWHDNYLCVPHDSDLNLLWSFSGAIDGFECVQINEPADPSTWHDNFLCISDFAGIGETCTDVELIIDGTDIGINIASQLVGFIPVVGNFISAAIDIVDIAASPAIEQAIKDGAIICSNDLWCCNSKCVGVQTNWAGVQRCNIWEDGTVCAHGSTCNNCRNEANHWASKGFTACGTEPKTWHDGTVCAHGTTCNACINPASYWRCKGFTACGSEHRSTGQSCSCALQCNSGCCDGGKCVNKKRDWAGVYYCPSICRGGAFKGPGTC